MICFKRYDQVIRVIFTDEKAELSLLVERLGSLNSAAVLADPSLHSLLVERGMTDTD